MTKLTIVECALKYGTGFYNIDGCRISGVEKSMLHKDGKNNKVSEHGTKNFMTNPEKKQDLEGVMKGRYPANLILGHHPDCEYLGEEEDMVGTNGGYEDYVIESVTFGKYKQKKRINRTSTISKYNCVEGCPCKEMDKQSGEIKSGTWNQTDGARTFNNNGKKTNYQTKEGIKDTGGASRFFLNIIGEENA